MDNTNIPLWGVVGLSDEEQRKVRGGISQPQNNRASCIRSAVQTYTTQVRNGQSRSSARATMLNNIANCGSGSCA